MRGSAIAAAMWAAACGSPSGPPRAQKTLVAAANPATTAGVKVPHGDHKPHHGGIVMMKGDLHYEVVLNPSGRPYHVYFTDAVREDLPASIASKVALTIQRPNEPDELIDLKIDEAGESWTGGGRPVAQPEKAGVRVAFTIAQEPYFINLPFALPK